MGQLIYGPGTVYEMDDRTLAHVHVAILAKLRRQESFALSWPLSTGQGSGRVSLWISGTIPLQFQFSGSRPPALNRTWVTAMLQGAHTDRGMTVITETDASATTPSRG